jgi:hypothetical protein
MYKEISARHMILLCFISVASCVLNGCGSKHPDATATAPSSNAAEGHNYAQGLAQMHSQRSQAPAANSAPNNP